MAERPCRRRRRRKLQSIRRAACDPVFLNTVRSILFYFTLGGSYGRDGPRLPVPLPGNLHESGIFACAYRLSILNLPSFSVLSGSTSPRRLPALHLFAAPSTSEFSFLPSPIELSRTNYHFINSIGTFFFVSPCPSRFASHGPSHNFSSSSFLLHQILHYSYPAVLLISVISLVPF